MQVALLMRSICKGETTRELAIEVQLNYKTALTMRNRVQANAELEQQTNTLPDKRTETGKMFQNVGKKANCTLIQMTLPGNEPINNADMEPMTTIVHPSLERESGQVRLRVVHNTNQKTLEAHVHRFTLKEMTCHTDE